MGTCDRCHQTTDKCTCSRPYAPTTDIDTRKDLFKEDKRLYFGFPCGQCEHRNEPQSTAPCSGCIHYAR